jgi:hypothetical protein
VLDVKELANISNASVDNFVDSALPSRRSPCKSRPCLDCLKKRQATKLNKINNLAGNVPPVRGRHGGMPGWRTAAQILCITDACQAIFQVVFVLCGL